MGKSESVQEEEPEFDWIQLHNELNSASGHESNRDRLIRKVKDNPFVPIGCIATSMALIFGLYSFKKGKRRMSQYMMRTRIVAQGFTVVALVVGLGLSAKKLDTQS